MWSNDFNSRVSMPRPRAHALGARARPVTLAVFVAVTFALIMPGTASATNYWSQTGAACVPDHDAITNNYHLVTAGTVKYKTNVTSRVYLNCGVEVSSSTNPNRLYLTYRHYEPSADAGAEVKALFYRQNRSTGALTLVTSVTSDEQSAPGDAEKNVSFSHTLNFTTMFYYVEGQFKRNETGTDVIFRGVSLDYSP